MLTGRQRAVAEVDLEAIRHNVRRLMRDLPEGAVHCAVVKADGSGPGSVAVARVALRAGVTGLCVALAQEGAERRAAGIDAPILVLSAQPDEEVGALLRRIGLLGQALVLLQRLGHGQKGVGRGFGDRLARPLRPEALRVDEDAAQYIDARPGRDVVEGDDAGGAAVLVDDDREVDACRLHLAQELVAVPDRAADLLGLLVVVDLQVVLGVVIHGRGAGGGEGGAGRRGVVQVGVHERHGLVLQRPGARLGLLVEHLPEVVLEDAAVGALVVEVERERRRPSTALGDDDRVLRVVDARGRDLGGQRRGGGG